MTSVSGLFNLPSFENFGLELSSGHCSRLKAFSPSPHSEKPISRMKAYLALFLLSASSLFADGAPTIIDLTQFSSGAAGTRVIGSSSTTRVSGSVVQIGDHNGDGFDDFIVGSAILSKAFIIMKQDAIYAEIDISSIVSGQYFRVIVGPSGTNLGGNLGALGDINADGFDDVIIGATAGVKEGRIGQVSNAFVIFGMEGPFTDVTVTSAWPATSVGFMFWGPEVNSGLMLGIQNGRGLGDVNGDGIDDFAVSCRLYKGTTTKSTAGVVFVIFGKKAPLTFTNIDLLLVPDNFGSNGIYFTGALAQDNLGYSIGPAGDFNGDGIADFLMGSPAYDPPPVNSVSRSNAGAVYLIHGSKTALATMDMSTFVTGTIGVRFLGSRGNDGLGRSVSGVGDINGDGLDDIAFGAYAADPPSRSNGGTVYVIYGTKTSFSAEFDLVSFIASPLGFSIYGRAQSEQLYHVAPAGDVNQDGVKDILVAGGTGISYTHLILGQTAARTAPVDTAVDNVITFFFTDGAIMDSGLDGGKDLNGDESPDLVLGARSATVTPESGGDPITNVGVVWMISGEYLFPSPTLAPTIPGSPAPTVKPSLAPSYTPSAFPSTSPSLVPSILPSATPSATPSMSPSVSPSVIPTLTLATPPSLVPSMMPSAAPSVSPSVDPSAAPSVMPSATPTVSPSVDPSAQPSLMPSAAPSVSPSVDPSAQPSLMPSTAPSVSPSVDSSVPPSLMPSAAPSVSPSVNPSAEPSVMPSAAPSVSPSVNPSAEPSLMPSADPSVSPSVDPSAQPSLMPSAAPTPTPSAKPTALPTIIPSTYPTFSPTASPTMLPTVSPTAVTTARPTVPAVKDYEVVVDVIQGLYNVSKASYDAQLVANNKTIQHTVADAILGVVPERVTDIIVEEEEEEEEVRGSDVRRTLTVRAVVLRYKITANDPTVSVNILRAKLVQAVQEGKMDRDLRYYAAQFGATRLNTVTFAEPLVTSAAVQRDASKKLTGVQIALLVIGVVVGLALLASTIWYVLISTVASCESLRCGSNPLEQVV